MTDLTAYDILDWIFYPLFSLVIIPVVLGIIKFSYLSKSDKYILYLLASILILEVFAEVLRWSIIRNHFVSYPVSCCLYFFTILFFESISAERLKKKYLIFTGIIIFIAIEVSITGLNQINSISKSVAYLLQIVLAVIYLRRLFKNTLIDKFSDKPSFWYIIAFAIWGSFAFLPTLLERYFIETSLGLYYFFDTLRLLGFAITSIIFAIGLWKVDKQPV